MAATAAASAAAAAAANSDEDDNYEEYIPVAKRRAMEAERLRQLRLSKPAPASAAASSLPLPPPPPLPPAPQPSAPDAAAKPSLLVKATQLKRAAPEVTATEQRIQQEKEVIDNLSDFKSLRSVREIAKGIIYTDPIETGWKPPLHLCRMPVAKANKLRRKWHIVVDGDDVPPPARDFRDLRLRSPCCGSCARGASSSPHPSRCRGCPWFSPGAT